MIDVPASLNQLWVQNHVVLDVVIYAMLQSVGWKVHSWIWVFVCLSFQASLTKWGWDEYEKETIQMNIILKYGSLIKLWT